MKKLLVLLMLVSLAAMASAALQISVGGDPEPVDSEINIEPSDHLVLDIWTDSDITPGVGETYWCLIAQPAEAAISGGVVAITGEPGTVIWGAYTHGDGQAGIYGGVALSTLPKIDAGTVIYDLIDFHCEMENDDTVITLIVDLYGTPTISDQVIIHQPEPMTIALLSLGGLFLRRRK